MPRGKPIKKRAKHIKKNPAKRQGGRINWQALEQRGLEAINRGVAPKVPIEVKKDGTRIDYNQPGWCAGYATRAAKMIFGLDYEKVHAWLLAEKNSCVLSLLKRGKGSSFALPASTRLSQFENALRPGRIIGVFFPNSQENARAMAEGRPYTHAMLYLGKHKGKHWVVHNVGGTRIQTIENALRGGSLGQGMAAEIIQPNKK